jgi:hypothetical protein
MGGAEWDADAVRQLGARAEVRTDGEETIVVFAVGNQVVDQCRDPRGREKALQDVGAFNRRVAARKMNPSETLADAWR